MQDTTTEINYSMPNTTCHNKNVSGLVFFQKETLSVWKCTNDHLCLWLSLPSQEE